MNNIIHTPPAGKPEQRSEILSELRQTIDALGEACERQKATRESMGKLLDMLAPSTQTTLLRQQIESDMEKLDALGQFNDHILQRVRSGAMKTFSELFER